MSGVTGIVWRYVCSAGMSQHGPTPNNVTENTVAHVYVEHWRQAREGLEVTEGGDKNQLVEYLDLHICIYIYIYASPGNFNHHVL